MNSDMSDDEFHFSQSFKEKEEIKDFLKDYNRKNFSNLVIASSNSKQIVIACRHGVTRNSSCSGKRPNQHYNYLACPVKVRMYKYIKPEEHFKVTSVNLSHNHPVTQEIYEQMNVTLNKDEEELVKTLKEANAKPSNITRVLLERSRKKVTIQKLKNLLSKIAPNADDREMNESLEYFLEHVEDEGGVVNWVDDDDGKMKAMFITSNKMKSAFKSSNPPLIQMDTSFEFESARYKVAAFCYLDTNSDKTEIAAFAMMSQETESCFKFVLEEFSKICVRQDLIFLIDKDFTEMETLRKVFPSSMVLLCVFHTLKYMRNLFATIPDTVEVKERINTQFKRLVYSNSAEIFQTENDVFLAMVENVQVRTSKKYVNLKDYYVRNWQSCKLMWARCYRKGLPLLGDNTTNRIENKFGRLKLNIQDTFTSLPKTGLAIIHLVKYAEKLLTERYVYGTMKSLKIFSSNLAIRQFNEEASLSLNDKGCKLLNDSLQMLEKKREMFSCHDEGVSERFDEKTVVHYTTNNINCNCSLFKTFQSPCAHVLFLREKANRSDNSFKIFDLSIFHSRYHRKDSLIDVINIQTEVNQQHNDEELLSQYVPVPDEDPIPLSNHRKYKLISPILLTIGNIISLHATPKFHEYLAAFEKIENIVRRGGIIFDDVEDGETSEAVNASLDESEDQNNNEELNDALPDCSELNTESVQSNDEDVLRTQMVSEPEGNRRFGNLRMKESVRTRGRPRKKNTQHTFNRTKADKVAKAKKQKSRKKQKTKKTFNVDDSSPEQSDVDMILESEEDISMDDVLNANLDEIDTGDA